MYLYLYFSLSQQYWVVILNTVDLSISLPFSLVLLPFVNGLI